MQFLSPISNTSLWRAHWVCSSQETLVVVHFHEQLALCPDLDEGLSTKRSESKKDGQSLQSQLTIKIAHKHNLKFQIPGYGVLL